MGSFPHFGDTFLHTRDVKDVPIVLGICGDMTLGISLANGYVQKCTLSVKVPLDKLVFRASLLNFKKMGNYIFSPTHM
jgi:hypothetical protein